jgi:hypothetical protein
VTFNSREAAIWEAALVISVAEQRELFAAAGFEDIRISEERAKGWICGVGKKPL